MSNLKDLLASEHEIWSVAGQKNYFFKVKTDSLGIGKIKFSFGESNKASNKLVSSLDCYLEISEALALAHIILKGGAESGPSKELLSFEIYADTVDKAQSKRMGNNVRVYKRVWFEKAMSDKYACAVRATCTPQIQDQNEKKRLSIAYAIPISYKDLLSTAFYIKSHCENFMKYLYLNKYDEFSKEVSQRFQSGEERVQISTVQDPTPVQSVARESKPLQTANRPEVLSREFFYCKNKGSEVIRRGNNNEIVVLKVVCEAFPGATENVFESAGKKWQMVELLFFDAYTKKNFSKEMGEVLKAIEDGADGKAVPHLDSLKVKLLDVRDGYRQVMFQTVA